MFCDINYCTTIGLCSGCGLCELVFGKDQVSMKLASNGFYRPDFKEFDEKSSKKNFIDLCPALNMKNSDPFLFGKIEKAYIGWSNNSEIRFKASSGGSLSSVLIYLIDSKIVDGIIHVGRDKNLMEARLYLSRTPNDIINNCGSLYMPTGMLNGLEDIVKEGERYAFVGKGCDIRALKQYLSFQKNIKYTIDVFIGIMCGGIPSINATRKLLTSNNIEINNLSLLKYRGSGWPGTFEAFDGINKLSLSYNEAWGKHLGPTSPLVCKVCFDGISGEADITFGDAWYCNDNHYPVFDEVDGRNLILIRSQRGKKIIEGARNDDYIVISEENVSDETIKAMQPSQTNRRCLAISKLIGLRVIGYKYPKVNWRDLYLINKKQDVSVKTFIRTVLGTIKRVLIAAKREQETE